jgi:hypothetical protein
MSGILNDTVQVDQLLRPIVKLKLGAAMMVDGKVRHKKGAIVKARLAHTDQFGSEILVLAGDASSPANRAVCSFGDLVGSQVVG